MAEAVEGAVDAALFGNGGEVGGDGVGLVGLIVRIVAGLDQLVEDPGGARYGTFSGGGFGILDCIKQFLV